MYVRHVDNSEPRRGAILVIVLVSILVASMLGVGLIKTVLIHKRQMRVLSGQQQGFWLAEAGVQRAVRYLADAPEYEGETWEVSADVLGASRTAQVTIEVAEHDELSDVRKIHVAVHLDDGRAVPNGYHREHEYRVPPTEQP